MERHRVILASNGREAYCGTLEDRPDLVLLDANMPVMDGYEVLPAIKRNRSTRSIPVVMLSGLDWANDRKQALELGAYDFIAKPIKLDEFYQVIQSGPEKGSFVSLSCESNEGEGNQCF